MSEKAGDKLGFWSIVLLAINAIIGSGIFLTPGSVVQQAGSKALVVYLIAAIFAAILAISFAAASSMSLSQVLPMLIQRPLLVIRSVFIWACCAIFQLVWLGA